MRGLRGRLAALALLAAAGACDSTAPVEPETLAIESGNNQNGSTDAPLADALTVRVTGSDGRPFAGASVRWQVVSGGAEVVPQTSSTNADGVASTAVTLGSTPGAVVVSATVDGLAPVSFSINATSQCDVIEPYTIGTTIEGALTTDDCRLADNTRADRFSFTLTEPQSIRFTQSSTAMNPFLSLEDDAGNPVAFHDDVSPADRTARMRVFLPPGAYVVAPSGSAPTDAGAYSFIADVTADAVTGCGPSGQDPIVESFFVDWLKPGVELSQDLTTTDCALQDQGGVSYHVDLYFVFLRQGETLTISQASSEFDTYLELYRVTASNIEFIAFNDDESGTSTNSMLTHDVVVNGIYMILPSTAEPQKVGTYTLGVN